MLLGHRLAFQNLGVLGRQVVSQNPVVAFLDLYGGDLGDPDFEVYPSGRSLAWDGAVEPFLHFLKLLVYPILDGAYRAF